VTRAIVTPGDTAGRVTFRCVRKNGLQMPENYVSIREWNKQKLLMW